MADVRKTIKYPDSASFAGAGALNAAARISAVRAAASFAGVGSFVAVGRVAPIRGSASFAGAGSFAVPFPRVTSRIRLAFAGAAALVAHEIVLRPTQQVAPPQDIQVAVEFDLYDDVSMTIQTLRLCSFGPLFSRSMPSENYLAKLFTPIQLGTAIAVQTYGQPQRALSNQGSIEFALDEDVLPYFGSRYHWIGRTFKVYEGPPPQGGFVDDLELIYVGRVADLTHDTIKATVRTGDTSTDIDLPLVSDLYPSDALADIVGKPRPQLWGTVLSIEPYLEDSINLVYRISRVPIQEVTQLRVGGIPWVASLTSSPAAGEYWVDAAAGTVTLGSSTAGGQVRCNAIGTAVSGIGGLLTALAQAADVPMSVDTAAMGEIDKLNIPVGYYAREPVNLLTALDDVATGAGCWWGITSLGLLTAGLVAAPAENPTVSTLANQVNIAGASLSQTIPPAWRISVEYNRRWQPSSQFFGAVSDTDRQRWEANGLNVSGEDKATLVAEPRAFDVPTIRSVVAGPTYATTIREIFANAWGVRRQIIDMDIWIDPREIELYGTIAVDYMMFQGNYIILSAVRAIGGGPAQLQLWG